MKRLVSCLMAVILVVGLMPQMAVAEVAGGVSSAFSEQASPALTSRLLYTRTMTLGTAGYGESWTVPIPLSLDGVPEGAVHVHFRGSTPKLYLLQLGKNSSWLYKVQLSGTSVLKDEGPSEWSTAVFSAADMNAAWTSDSVTRETAAETGGIEKGAFNYCFVTKDWIAQAPTTVDEVALAGVTSSVPVKTAAVEGLAAADITENMKIGWNLGNTLDSHYNPSVPAKDGGFGRADIDAERLWGNPFTTKAMIDAVKAKGFNAVRIPVTWYQHIYPEGDPTGSNALPDDPVQRFHIDRAWMARVREVVDYAYGNGMYVILNTHHEMWTRNAAFGTDEGLAAMKQQFTAIWSQIASEFASYDQRLVFEGLNEPRSSGEGISHDQEWGVPSPGDVATLNELNQAFVNVVRDAGSGADSHNGERLLMVPTNSASGNTYAASQLVVPTDPRTEETDPETGKPYEPHIAVSVHAYEPASFTSSDGAYSGEDMFDKADEAALESVFYGIHAAFTSKGIPVVIGEFGIDSGRYDNAAECMKWAESYIGLASGYGMPCFLWDNGTPDSKGADMSYLDRTLATPAWKADRGRADVVDVLVSTAGECGSSGTWGSRLGAPVFSGLPTGRVLNEASYQLEKDAVDLTPDYQASWGDLQGGDVAATFTGTVPTLVMKDADGGNWTEVRKPSYVAWDWSEGPVDAAQASGVAYWWPSHIEATWKAATAKRAARENCDGIARLAVRTYGSTLVKSVVLSGCGDAPDVSDGGYGSNVDVRLLYTRPLELVQNPDDAALPKDSFRTPLVNVERPEVDGKDFAVRFTGKTPYLVFVYAPAKGGNWVGWMTMQPYQVVQADDDTGQKVAFFSRHAVDRKWAASSVGMSGHEYNELLVCVEGGACQLVEVVAVGGEPRTAPAMADPATAVSGQQVVESLYAGYNLGGHMESNWVPGTDQRDGGWGQADIDLELHWSRGTCITPQTIAALKERGFRAVRIPVTWFQHLYDQDGDPSILEVDRAWMQRVHEIVDYCFEADMHVIINLHHERWVERLDMNEPGVYESQIRPQFIALWKRICEEFADYDQRLVFEGINEPHAQGAPDDREWNKPTAGDIETINKMAGDFVNTVRDAGKENSDWNARRLLLVTPYAAHADRAADEGFIVPYGENIAVSLHPYMPYGYVADETAAKAGGQGHSYTGKQRELLERTMEWVRAKFTSKGVPVVFGEFGCYYYGAERETDRVEWMHEYMTQAKELGIPCFYWQLSFTTEDNDVVYNMYDENTHEWTEASKAVTKAWFNVLGDPGIERGGRALIGAGEHAGIGSGAELLDAVKTIDHREGAASGAFNTARLPLAWSQLEGNEVAVKFTGTWPQLVLLNDSWDGGIWGEVYPRTVDEEAGVAYFPAAEISRYWLDEHENMDEFAGVSVLTPTGGLTELQSVAVLESQVPEWSAWSYGRSPSCAETGVRQRTRDVFVQSFEVPMLGHEWGAWETVSNPTCSQTGLEKRVCGNDASHEQVRAIPIDANAHRWGSWAVVRQPTYDRSGVEARTCENDPAHMQTRPIAALVREDAPVDGESDIGKPSQAESAAAGAPGNPPVVEPSLPTRSVSAKAGKSSLLVDVKRGKVATVVNAKSVSGTVKLDKVTTSDGRKCTVTVIAPSAFAAAKLTKITIGPSVTRIGSSAFKNCKKLKSVTLGKSVKSVGKGVFKGCKKLKTLKVRTAKLTKASFKNVLSGSKIKTVKLVGMSKKQKSRTSAKYANWLPKGVSLR